MDIKSEDLAYWFLRLNGFLTIQNFIVHPDEGACQRTDVDLVAVRFPFRSELASNPMKDFHTFSEIKKPLVLFTEVKRGRCRINGPWTARSKENMQRVLRAIGTHDPSKINEIASSLYDTGIFEDNAYSISLLSIGKDLNLELQQRYPRVNQILFTEILKFVYERFDKYPDRKADHHQWETNGKNLWKTFDGSRSVQEYIDSVIVQ